MAFTDPEVRVLAALIEKEAAVPESYPLTLNALRLACNQATNRRPVVSYDDRTVEAALLSLKSVGLDPLRSSRPTAGARPAIDTPPTSDGVCRPANCSCSRRSPCVDPRPSPRSAPGSIACSLPASRRRSRSCSMPSRRAVRKPLAVRLGRRPGRARRPLGGGDRAAAVSRDRRRGRRRRRRRRHQRPTRLRRAGVARRVDAEASRRPGGDGHLTGGAARSPRTARVERRARLAGLRRPRG